MSDLHLDSSGHTEALSLTEQRMPVLGKIEGIFARERPLASWNILLNLHMTEETARLGRCLLAGGGTIWYLPSNRNPSPANVVSHVQKNGRVLDSPEQLDALTWKEEHRFLVVEGNGRFFSLIHDTPGASNFTKLMEGISMHTSGGGHKVDAFDAEKVRLPVVAVYRDPLKGQLETGLGTSQSALTALLRGFRMPPAGRRTLVVGFGNVGAGLAHVLTTLGAHVRITEVDAERRLAAHLAGFRLIELEQGLSEAEICLMTTGTASVLNADTLRGCRDCLCIANLSDAPNEVDTSDCEFLGQMEMTRSLWRVPDGPRFELLGDGLQINHVLGVGNPSSLMDLSFSLHALVLQWLAKTPRPAGVLPVPEHIRETVATLAVEV